MRMGLNSYIQYLSRIVDWGLLMVFMMVALVACHPNQVIWFFCFNHVLSQNYKPQFGAFDVEFCTELGKVTFGIIASHILLQHGQ